MLWSDDLQTFLVQMFGSICPPNEKPEPDSDYVAWVPQSDGDQPPF